ncbi:LPXTG cell wall anchor domain-containing protein [Enterococcus ureasiticus]|uniref:Gram-positive cocci surface proteins LPxTG domain-containing protein n=1 Tax=Enterococcus ureasiticus TaxID=903984 RepID=A0A1E5GF50_9ENTE|nr:LPXTG cell wall anchor domain-containing protein [Enterococcus ureasiticus]OEG11332.1 hypothetical protein BCR21_08510 [Enterococcus ureasiticus]
MKKIVCIMGFALLCISLLSPSSLTIAEEYNGPANSTTVGGIRFYETEDTRTTTTSNPSASKETELQGKPKELSSKPRFPNTGETSTISILVIGLVLVLIAFVWIMKKRSKR